MADPPDESRELSLINKVELKIALADTDSKLQSLLLVYLAPLLLKLASPHLAVRNKIISLCSHINARIKTPSIKLPVEALLKQFKDPEVGGKHALVRNFDLMYIQQGVGRMEPKDRITLLPLIVSKISTTVPQQQPLIFHILLEILVHFTPPPRGSSEDSALRSHFAFDTNPEDAEYLHTWFTRLMLLTYQAVSRSGSGVTCRGLHPDEYDFLTLGKKKETWNPPGHLVGEKLKMAKIAVLKFLNTGAFTDEQRYLPSLVASSHSVVEDSKVVELAEEIFKRSAPGMPLDGGRDGIGERMIEKLYELLLGGKGQDTIPPIRWTFRARIVAILSKSKKAVSGRFGDNVPIVVRIALGPNQNEEDDPGWYDSERDRKKLSKELFVYVNWFARVSDIEAIEKHGPLIAEQLKAYTLQETYRILQGNAASGAMVGAFQGADDFRPQANEVFGQICRRLFKTMVYEEDLHNLRYLFSALWSVQTLSTAALRRSVEEALGSLLIGFNDPDLQYNDNVENALAEFLVETVENGESGDARSSGVKYIATRFANRGLSFRNVKGRWICLLAAGSGGLLSTNSGGRSELVEEGKRGLNPYWYTMLNPASDTTTGKNPSNHRVSEGDKMDIETPAQQDRYSFPDFVQLIEYVTSKHERLEGGNGKRTMLHNIPVEIYPLVVDFCRRVFMMEALRKHSAAPTKLGERVELDADSFTTRLDMSMATDLQTKNAVAELISSYYASEEKAVALKELFSMAYDGMLMDLPSCAETWVELCELAPHDLMVNWATDGPKVLRLQRMLLEGTFSVAGGSGNFDLEKRNLLIKALGSVAAHPECDTSILHSLLTKLHEMHGLGGYKSYTAVVCLGYILGRLALRKRLFETLDETTVENSVNIVLRAIQGNIGPEKIVIEAGLHALSELCVFGVMEKKYLSADAGKALWDRVVELAKKDGMEKAILTSACYSLLFDSSDDEDAKTLGSIEQLLYDLHENKQLELSFAVGEALTIFAAGWSSLALQRRYLDIQGCLPADKVANLRKDGSLLAKILGKLLDEFAKSTKPSLRRGVCVWLFSLIESCGTLEVVNKRLKDAQTTFKSFLVDRDEFVQETASRGITLVYEKGDKELKDELVRSLIASFTGDTKAQTLAGQVSADTQLFEPGTLQTGTSDHGSISTYKDIMSLASEVGDPSLIYRFMALARHNSLWASRASFGRFGLGNILSSSTSSVDGYLTENPKLYPKLYRYRFDPNPNVRKSMNDIWSALVRDTQKVLDKYFDDILKDLLKTIIDREWRVREASCAALGDLLQGREVVKYAKYLEQIWGLAFKVMDDIKESVRVAAFSLCRILAGQMVKVVKVDSGASQKEAELVLQHLMPFLLGIQGLEAQAKDVQYFALDTLMKLIKNAGKTLKGYIPELIEKLLGLLSTLEPQALNYLHLNAAKYNLTEDKIDAARLSGVRSSPLMDAIEHCLDLLDEPTMAKLIPNLIHTIRKAIGMPSKVGTSRVLVTLVIRHSFVVRPHADELLKAVMSIILDRNDAVSTSWAVAAGYLCRLCGDNQVLALVELAKKFWFESEEERARALAGEIVHDISKHSADKFNALAASILPFIFLAKHDASSTLVSSTFSSVWSENTGGTGAIKLYLKEIASLAQQNLGSQRWAVKQAAAQTLSDICTSLGKDATKQEVDVLYSAMIEATSGKSWEGKEKVLKGFVELSVHFTEPGSKERRDMAHRIVLREAKRRNRGYQAHALKSLGRFCEIHDKLDMFDEVEEIVASTLEEEDEDKVDRDKMDIDERAGRTIRSAKHTAYLNSVYAISQAFCPSLYGSGDAQKRLEKVLAVITTTPSSVPLNFETKIAQAIALDAVLSRISTPSNTAPLPPMPQAVLIRMWGFILPFAEDKGSEELRTKAVKGAVVSLAAIFVQQGGPEVKEQVKENLKSLAEAERSNELKKELMETVKAFGG